MNSPEVDVDFPFEVLEQVGDRFEGVVGTGIWVGEQMEEGFDGSLVGGVEKEVFPECRECSEGGSGDGVCFEVVSGE
jgi:hypothetical protein